MKQFKSLILVLIVVAIPSLTMAQNQKIAYFDSDVVLANIPEYQGIEQQLRLLTDTWKTELANKDKEIKALQQDYEAKEILYTDEIREQKKADISALLKAREGFMAQKFGPSGEYFTRQKELLEPIQRQVFAAVRTVAERQGVDFVFDRAGDIYMVFARSEWNLNESILLELGIDVDDLNEQ
ncbi:MAG: OmpH family outer membrane protein [Balneolaceae bacterium]